MKDPDLKVGYHGYLFTGGEIPPNQNVIMNKCTHEVWLRSQGVLTLVETPSSFIFVDVENNKAYRVTEERLKRICYNFILKDLLTLQIFRFYNGELSIMLPIFPGGTPTVIINSARDINGKPAGTNFILFSSLEINSQDVIFPDNSTVTFTANHTADLPPVLKFNGGSVTGNNITFIGNQYNKTLSGGVILTGNVNVSNFGLTMVGMGSSRQNVYSTNTPGLTIIDQITGNFKSLIISNPSLIAVYLDNSNLRVADFRLSTTDTFTSYPLILLNNSNISIQGSSRNFNIDTGNHPLFEIIGVGQFITNHDGTTTGSFNSNNLFYRIAEGSQVFIPRHYKLYTTKPDDPVSLNGDSDLLKPPLGIYKRPVIVTNLAYGLPTQTEPAINYVINGVLDITDEPYTFPPNSVVYLSKTNLITGGSIDQAQFMTTIGISCENLRVMNYSGPETTSTDGGGMLIFGQGDFSNCDMSLINMGSPDETGNLNYHTGLTYTPALTINSKLNLHFKSLKFYNSFTTSIRCMSTEYDIGPTLQFDYLGISQTTPIHSPSKAIIHMDRTTIEIIRRLGGQNSFNIDSGSQPLFYMENVSKFTTQLGEAIALGSIIADKLFGSMNIDAYLNIPFSAYNHFCVSAENLGSVSINVSINEGNTLAIEIQSPC